MKCQIASNRDNFGEEAEEEEEVPAVALNIKGNTHTESQSPRLAKK